MSKESYIRGFCKVAEEHGVDPVQLAKFAEDTGDAGIGSYYANSWESSLTDGGKRGIPNDSNSYVGKLLARYNKEPTGAAHIPLISPLRSKYELVTPRSIESGREASAAWGAARFFPFKSAPWKRIEQNLTNAGKENLKSYLETGEPVDRSEPDLRGIESLKLTPEQLELLKKLQNTMVRKGTATPKNIA